MRLLHAGHPDVARCAIYAIGRMPPNRKCAIFCRAICAAAPATHRSSQRRSTRRRRLARGARACLISAPASLQASSAIPTRWPSSTATLRLTYAQWYTKISALVAALRRARTAARRPSGHGAAEPLGGRDPPLGLPVRRHRHHAAELARQGRRDRLSASRMPRPRPSSSRTSPPRPSPARTAGASACRASPSACAGTADLDFDGAASSRSRRRRRRASAPTPGR